MKLEFKHKKHGEIKKCEFTLPESIKNRDKKQQVRFIVRMMMNYIYDHDIEKQDWIDGYIYDNDICLGEIDYVGNFINEEKR